MIRIIIFICLMGVGVLAIGTPAFALQANDPFVREQWYLPTIGAPEAWDISTGAPEVVVAVLDTGVDLDHPDLRANIWRNRNEIPGDGVDNDRNGFIDDVHGWNFVEHTASPTPVTSGGTVPNALNHGTLIAGIIAAIGNNQEGIAGIAWKTTIMPVRVLDSRGTGETHAVIAGIDYAVRNGADIINLSFTTDQTAEAFKQAIRRAHDAGVLVVAAIGNDSSGGRNTDTNPMYPACADGGAGENWVLGVAATTPADQKSVFSNYGSVCVDVSAPGEGIFGAQFADASLMNSQSYGGRNAGTSLAAPQVSGAAALVLATAPRLKKAEVVRVLLESADGIDDKNESYRGKLGAGRINVKTAVRRARDLGSRRTTATIAVSGEAGPPQVWLMNDVGTLIGGFLAYEESYRGGVRVAAADIDRDAVADIITAPGSGRAPTVRVFGSDGSMKSEFPGYGDEMRAGVQLASGDVDGDGTPEIVVGPGPGALPQVRVFSPTGELRSEFLAFTSGFRGGVEVAVGDLEGDGTREVIVGVQSGGGPQIRIFDWRGNLKGQFFAFEEYYRNGVRLGVADVGGNVGAELLVTRGRGETARVHELRADGTPWNSILAFGEDQHGPLAVASRKTATASAEIFVGGGKRNEFPSVHGLTPIGALLTAFPVPSSLGTTLHIATL